jgi:hypothetical protein
MKHLLFFIFLFLNQNLYSQEEQEPVHIVEYHPLCLNCKEKVEEFLNQRLNSLNLHLSDTITINYELTAQGKVENVRIAGTDNPDMVELSIQATENITEWIPAIQRNNPVWVKLQYQIIPDYNSDRFSVKTKLLPSADLDYFLIERNSRFWRTYFEENSFETISHFDIKILHRYIYSKLNKDYNRRLTKSPYYKTGTIRIQIKGEKTEWSIFVPKLKISDSGNSQNRNTLRIKDIPIDHEIIIIVIKEQNNRITISMNELNYSGQRDLNLSFREYSFREINNQIEQIIEK